MSVFYLGCNDVVKPFPFAVGGLCYRCRGSIAKGALYIHHGCGVGNHLYCLTCYLALFD